MNLQLGIYEIFSAIIPGCVYLAAVFQVLILTGVIKWDWETMNGLSVFSAIFLLILAYLFGVTLGRFGLLWYKLFKRTDQSVESLKSFRSRHQARWDIDFDDRDWHILLAFIRSRNMDLAREIERHLASSIMLRNVSLGFFMLAAINFVQSYYVRDWRIFVFGMVWAISSILMIFESMRSRRWYYDTMLSTIIAQRLDLEKSIKPIEPAARRKKSRRQDEE